MTKFQISTTRSGLVIGLYDAETAEAALDAMARDAGYKNYAEACKVAPVTDTEILVTEIGANGERK